MTIDVKALQALDSDEAAGLHPNDCNWTCWWTCLSWSCNYTDAEA